MTTWPSNIDIPKKITEKIVKVSYRSTSESGYSHTRPKWTGSKKEFSLHWPDIETADKDVLQAFFNDNLGSNFTWPHPVSGEHDCIFSQDELEFESMGFSNETAIYAVTVDLEEQGATWQGEGITFGEDTLVF